jgi:hypothetical protein
MNVAITGSPARILTVPDVIPDSITDAVPADQVVRGHQPERSWVRTLVEALAYAGASFDPAAALAARRLAGIRDQELRRSRR